jgi:hypothetical protein
MFWKKAGLAPAFSFALRSATASTRNALGSSEANKAGANLMKKFLLGAFGLVVSGMTAPAVAADLPVRTYSRAPAIVATVYDWGGSIVARY